MALANSWLESTQTMPVNRSLRRHRSQMWRHRPFICHATTFQQWLLRKYRWRPERAFGSPGLVFRRGFHPVTSPSWQHVTTYLLHIALTFPMALHRSGASTMPQGGVGRHIGLPFRPMTLRVGPPPRRTGLAADGRHDGIRATPGVGSWINQRGSWRPSVQADVFSVSSLTYQLIQKAGPPALGRFTGKVDASQTRLGESNGHLRIPQAQHPVELSHPRASAFIMTRVPMFLASGRPGVQSLLFGQPTGLRFMPMASQASSIAYVRHHAAPCPTELPYLEPSITFTAPKMIARLVGHTEGSISIDDAPRPMELPGWQPATLTLARPEAVLQPLRREGRVASVEQPLTGVQSLSTMPRTSSLDISHLTDQVYQALERKIRLEKQRRGYR
jgi:hypothetical protein